MNYSKIEGARQKTPPIQALKEHLIICKQNHLEIQQSVPAIINDKSISIERLQRAKAELKVSFDNYKKSFKTLIKSMKRQGIVDEAKQETSEFEKNYSCTKLISQSLYHCELEITENASSTHISAATSTKSCSINSKKSTQSQLKAAISEKDFDNKLDELDVRMQLVQLEAEKKKIQREKTIALLATELDDDGASSIGLSSKLDIIEFNNDEQKISLDNWVDSTRPILTTNSTEIPCSENFNYNKPLHYSSINKNSGNTKVTYSIRPDHDPLSSEIPTINKSSLLPASSIGFLQNNVKKLPPKGIKFSDQCQFNPYNDNISSMPHNLFENTNYNLNANASSSTPPSYKKLSKFLSLHI